MSVTIWGTCTPQELQQVASLLCTRGFCVSPTAASSTYSEMHAHLSDALARRAAVALWHPEGAEALVTVQVYCAQLGLRMRAC